MSDAGYISDSDDDSGIGRPLEPLEQDDDNFSDEEDEEVENGLPPAAMQVPLEQVTISQEISLEEQQEAAGPSTTSSTSTSNTSSNKEKKKQKKKGDEDKDEGSDNKDDNKDDEPMPPAPPPAPSSQGYYNYSNEVESNDDEAMLRLLKMKRNESRKLNHAEVQEEEKRSKLPANWEAKRRRVEWELADEQAREEASKSGLDYNIIKNMDTPAQELEFYGRKAKKKNPDPGFSDFAASHFRQYERITGRLRVNDEAYESQREKMGESFYPAAGDIITTGKTPQAAIDKMAADVEKQILKRSKFSRRRTHVDDADISYINERNKKFNEKCERFYGQYTEEIKQNLERGTAL